jgi:hypothetical protein
MITAALISIAVIYIPFLLAICRAGAKPTPRPTRCTVGQTKELFAPPILKKLREREAEMAEAGPVEQPTKPDNRLG